MSVVSLNSINRKIEETKKMIDEFSALESSEFAKCQKKELTRRLNSLEKEKSSIIESQAKESILLRIYGESVETGRISSRILVSVLDGFQTMMDNIANVLIGTNALRGQLKDYAKEITEMDVCGTFAGSFGIKLEKNYKQLELTHETLQTNNVLSEVFGILENSTDGIQLIEKISPYGQRTVQQYKKWLKDMESNSVNLELDWINEVSEKRKLDLEYVKSKDIIFTLDSIRGIKEEVVFAEALLTGINIRRNTFELKDTSGKIIKGKSRLETLIKVSEYMGKDVKAKLIKSTSESSVCGEREIWFLDDIN